MTPKEKAKELYLKFYIPDYCYAKAGMSSDWRKQASKKLALMAVDEVILSNPHSNPFNTDVYSTMEYWHEVKNELEKYI
jgi:hypothetical protein